MKIKDSELATLIIRRFKQQNPNLNWREVLLKDGHTVADIFTWTATIEGYKFWYNVYEKTKYKKLSSFLKENLNKNHNFVDLQLFI